MSDPFSEPPDSDPNTSEARPPVRPGRIVVPPMLEEERKSGKKRGTRSGIRAKMRTVAVSLTRDAMLGSYVSFAFHFFLFLFLAFVFTRTTDLPQTLLSGGFSRFEDAGSDTHGDTNDEENAPPIPAPQPVADPETPAVSNDPATQNVVPPSPSPDTPIDEPKNATGGRGDEPAEHSLETELREQIDLLHAFTSHGNDGFAGRNPDNRGRRGGPGDPTERSEEAVEAGLRWIVTHQDRDGGWSFNLGTCRNCSHPGTHSSRIAATSLALLPFLGAGYTHLDGNYREAVRRGLDFLLDPRNHVELSIGLNLQQGPQGMYSQGLATIVLCEAYGMTRGRGKTASLKRFEEKLGGAAQNAIRFIENAQDTMEYSTTVRYSGGWRYRENSSPGDLSVTGWQALALKSAALAGLEVKSTTLVRLDRFLDHTNYDHGRRYNYLPLKQSGSELIGRGESIGRHPDSEFTCTAIGLLLRMYLGRRPGDEPLDGGIDLLDEWGALKTTQAPRSARGHCNLYYAYYGTLALHHYGGSVWNRWFPELRDFLIDNQSTAGHENGSWFFSDPYCNVGGRLMNTSLAVMILEVRYRYMPLYDGK